ncbi:transposase [Rhizobium sp. NZLR1b]|uniref:transposase n=1 Tax=unclassified Rhizobium TaxID=2613769 RepID=UPI0038683C30
MAGREHGAKSRRSWRKLHLALDADSGEIIADVMTDHEAGDPRSSPCSTRSTLRSARSRPMGPMTVTTYDAVARHSANAAVVIPARINAVDRSDIETTNQRDRHIAAINTDGRMKWQAATDYGKRPLIETAIGRYKSIIGHRLRARSFGAQQTEVAIGYAVLNRMLACARPKSSGHGIAEASKSEIPLLHDRCTKAIPERTEFCNLDPS